MGEPRYRRGRAFASDMAVYTRTISSDNGAEHQRLKRNLIRALQEEVTPLQRKYLLLYYSEGLNMREIADRFGVERSTVSRTELRPMPQRTPPALRERICPSDRSNHPS